MGENSTTPLVVAFMSGGGAGLCVDLTLFPLDTVKTRLQSQTGFWKTGGVRGIYAGIGSVAVGSVPSAALFFFTYEAVKSHWQWKSTERGLMCSHMFGASCGEVVACLIRVPVEVVKQRSQVSPSLSSLHVFSTTVKQEGIGGLYRGYLSTVIREVPFSLIQFPLWEFFKRRWARWQGHDIDAWQSSICGAASGGLAAGLTTPLDVAKTRIMLAQAGGKLAEGNVVYALRHVWQEKGFPGLFAGFVPRVMWISIGGAIFLGVYDKLRFLLTPLFKDQG